ncbi:glycosyltransferase family 2 protein [Candidatus Woesearchaeota archaeon]|nr:glycosyltransferase family 2 protein [Candidatus Woesearchaeota archaeon]
MEKIIVTIPAYNEEKTIGRVVKDISCVLKKYPRSKIQVFDDGSRDSTAQRAKDAGARVISNHTNLGLARTFQLEIAECVRSGADIIVHTDADGQYRADDIPKLIEMVRSGYDLVLGNRFSGGIERMHWLKRLGNLSFTVLVSLLSQKHIGDAQTGFRAFTRAVAISCPITSNYTYTQEQILKTSWSGFLIGEVPTQFSSRIDESRLIKNPFHYAMNVSINLIRLLRDYSPMKFFSLGSGMCIIISLFLLSLWHVSSSVDTSTLFAVFSGIFFLLALQLFLIGLLSDMFRKTV